MCSGCSPLLHGGSRQHSGVMTSSRVCTRIAETIAEIKVSSLGPTLERGSVTLNLFQAVLDPRAEGDSKPNPHPDPKSGPGASVICIIRSIFTEMLIRGRRGEAGTLKCRGVELRGCLPVTPVIPVTGIGSSTTAVETCGTTTGGSGTRPRVAQSSQQRS